jgi:superfamily II DNA/RNA helicase
VTVDHPVLTDLALPAALTRALARQGITTPTAIQSAVVPDALAGHDVLGRARTGSGKTLAFGLPVLARLANGRSRAKSPRGLVILPTRELANQVHKALEPLAQTLRLRVATVYGGTSYDRQIRRLREGVDIVVATPGRLDDLIKRGACRLDQVEIVVLDEADHLCDLGFYPAVNALVGQTPPSGQRLLLSATLDGDVDRLVKRHLKSPVTHEVDPGQGAVTTMDHHVLVVTAEGKVEATKDLLRANPRSIVFTRTRHGATALARKLNRVGVTAVDLHGSLSQNARERNLSRFRSGQANVVVATDVAARGIHVDGVGMVVHYDMPTESKAYLHRSGRTARAGSSGAVVTVADDTQVSQVLRLHRTAGVESRHHDARTAPQPMTPEALSEAGTPSAQIQPKRSAQPSRTRRSGGGRPGRGRPQQRGQRRRTAA